MIFKPGKGGLFMAQWNKDAEQVMAERFDKDTVIALATVDEETPHVRFVNAIYTDGVFYFITDARSNKIRHMEKQPVVAIAGEWFTAHGRAVNLGTMGQRGKPAYCPDTEAGLCRLD